MFYISMLDLNLKLNLTRGLPLIWTNLHKSTKKVFWRVQTVVIVKLSLILCSNILAQAFRWLNVVACQSTACAKIFKNKIIIPPHPTVFIKGTVHILHHHVRGGWGAQAQMMTLMVPLGEVGGSKAK